MRFITPTFIILAVALTTIGTLMMPHAFAFTLRPKVTRHRLYSRLAAVTTRTLQDLTEPEQRVYSLMESLHESHFSFRIVVVGNGAILETTSKLGPKMKLNASPKTGKALLTLASEDQSFEFHLSPGDTAKIVLAEQDTGGNKIMRVIRFLSSEGTSMCSLILGEHSPEAVTWYNELRITYGEEMQL